MRDTIYRDAAIEAVCGVVIDEFDVSPTKGYEVSEHALSELPSAGPQTGELISREEPTVIRSRTFMPTNDFKEWAERIREVNPNAVVIPCDAEVVLAEAVTFEDVMQIRNTILFKEYMRGRRDAEAVQGWIPCSERLPKENGEYIVSLEDSVYPWARFFNGKWFMLSINAIAREFGEYEVIAWMSWPEPYEEASNDKTKNTV